MVVVVVIADVAVVCSFVVVVVALVRALAFAVVAEQIETMRTLAVCPSAYPSFCQSICQSSCFSLGFTLLLISCLLDSLTSREETSQNEAKQARAGKQSRRQLELLLMMSASQSAACVCPSYAN